MLKILFQGIQRITQTRQYCLKVKTKLLYSVSNIPKLGPDSRTALVQASISRPLIGPGFEAHPYGWAVCTRMGPQRYNSQATGQYFPPCLNTIHNLQIHGEDGTHRLSLCIYSHLPLSDTYHKYQRWHQAPYGIQYSYLWIPPPPLMNMKLHIYWSPERPQFANTVTLVNLLI